MGLELFYNAYLCEALYFRSGALKSPRRKYSKGNNETAIDPLRATAGYEYVYIYTYFVKENQNLTGLYRRIKVYVLVFVITSRGAVNNCLVFSRQRIIREYIIIIYTIIIYYNKDII